MGIDMYLRWNGQTKDEQEALVSGNVGYLREAYHGGPYGTQKLAPECWASDENHVAIPAATLRERLPGVLETVKERSAKVYPGTSEKELAEVQKAFSDFVELAEIKERETGQPCTVVASY
jgi:hypothetical protein